MKTIATAHFENGDTVTTLINTDAQGAVDYYYKKTFNLGDGAEATICRNVLP
jgi:hypothetical protein